MMSRIDLRQIPTVSVPMTPEQTRCTQAERDAVLDLLGRYCHLGVLDRAQFGWRTERAAGMEYVSGLLSMITDLPTLPAAEPKPPEKRCTRADRDQVADVLSQHFSAGSLDQDEFSERMEKAMTAKFPGDLLPLLADLPDLPAEEIVPVPAVSGRRLSPVPLPVIILLWLIVIAVACALWFITVPAGIVWLIIRGRRLHQAKEIAGHGRRGVPGRR